MVQRQFRRLLARFQGGDSWAIESCVILLLIGLCLPILDLGFTIPACCYGSYRRKQHAVPA
jgi:hypothetical protein